MQDLQRAMYYANYTAEMLRAINLDGVAFACANMCLSVRICMDANISIYVVYIYIYIYISLYGEDIRVYITLFSFVPVSLCIFLSLLYMARLLYV